jgi:DNA-binding response OmpR family regulator
MTSIQGLKGPVSILIYSSDADVRSHVQDSLGDSINDVEIQWHEVATFEALRELANNSVYNLLILDGEAHKVGGMGAARELKNSIYNCPPILLLTGRAQDAWLASWSLADGAVPRPLDVFELQEAVRQLLTQELVVSDI